MTWSTTQIDVRIDEYKEIRPHPGQSEAALLETALFVEEVFGIRISDEEITYESIGTFGSLRRFVIAKLGI